jgi:uncharacterized membrane protein YjjP (DUF1212 family)
VTWPIAQSMQTDAAQIVGQAIGLLYANGQTTQRVISESTRLAMRCGLELRVQAHWDGLICQTRALSERQSDDDWHEQFLPIRPAGVDMNKVAATNRLIDRLCSTQTPIDGNTITQFRETLSHIAAEKPSSNGRFILFAGLGAAALGIIFGAIDPIISLLIFLTAAMGAAARRWLAHITENLFLQPFVAALIAGASGGIVQQFIRTDGIQFIEIAPCMILVPGAHILNASLDLLRGRINLGVARAAYCIIILLSICVGLILGLTLTNGSLNVGAPSASIPIWIDMLAAGVAVSAFAAFFSLPWKMLWAPVLVGMVCHGGRWIVLDAGMGVGSATLLACLIAGTAMTLTSWRLKLPFAALAFASVVAMMPGIFVFKFADGLVEIYASGTGATVAMITSAMSDGFAALLIVLAMSMGLIIPKMLLEGWVARGA